MRPVILLVSSLIALSAAAGCATWTGVAEGPRASVRLDAHLPDALNAVLRVQVHEFGDKCATPRLSFLSWSYRGRAHVTEPPYQMDLPAGRRVWLNLLYHDRYTACQVVAGFTLEADREYAAIYRNDGGECGFGLTDSRTGARVPVVDPNTCKREP